MENLFPGQKVSMDHFKVTQKGRLYNTTGIACPEMMYSGEYIFVDHTTGDTHIEHLINFHTTEMIQVKQ